MVVTLSGSDDAGVEMCCENWIDLVRAMGTGMVVWGRGRDIVDCSRSRDLSLAVEMWNRCQRPSESRPMSLCLFRALVLTRRENKVISRRSGLGVRSQLVVIGVELIRAYVSREPVKLSVCYRPARGI
jgi:hypothetical protein